MPRAIADSDDDEDDLFAETNHVQPAAVISEHTGGANTEAGVDNEQSTGSTEHLRRQIQIAERGLFTNSASEIMRREPVISSDSPSVRVTKRRNTAGTEMDESNGSQRSAKRTKTTHTYGSKRQSNVLVDNATFEQLMEDDAAPRTSQSAHFTEHSGLASSAVLPSGNILDDFLNHEPNLMFRDSGSTVADTSSAQQRLLAQRRAEATGSDNQNATKASANEEQDSSIPFSTMGDQTDTGYDSQQKSPGENLVTEDATVVDAQTTSEPSGPVNNTVDPRQLLLPTNEEVTRQSATQGSQVISDSNIVLSPTVEIPRNENAETKSGQEAAEPPKKARLGRIRKANTREKTEAPVSDDRPVGLPAEQYKPRPSKRRATAIAEDAIDYSVRPEKAAAAKRRKSASIGTASEDETTHQDVTRAAVDSTDTSAKTAVSAHQAVTDDATVISQQAGDRSIEGSQSMASKGPTEADPTQISGEGSESSEIVVVPVQSAQKSKSGLKSKRSRTAVLEDDTEGNVPLEVPARSPQKRSILQEVENDAKRTQRKRKNVIVEDDDDDEDDCDGNEPVKESKTVQEETTAKKRGRGRPAKSTAKTQPEVTEEVTTASGDNNENQPPPPETGAKKAGRGRPSKTSKASKSALNSNDNQDKGASAHEPSNEAPASQTKAETDSQSTKAKSEITTVNRSSGELPTPSPDKQNIAKKDAKPKPASNPDKGPSKVTYRVGLSQRARIPPLHRNIKPQKR